MAADELILGFVGMERRVVAGSQLSFGRAADVVIDEDNLFLHRIVGRFVWWEGFWWVDNLSNAIELQLVGEDGTLVRLPEGKQAPLTWPRSVVRFSAGGLPYELEVAVPAGRAPAAPRVAPTLGLPTTRYGEVVLTDEERAMLLQLARPFLLDPSAGPERLPANRRVAADLGWPVSKLNRKLDYLCSRLTQAGVRDLHGKRSRRATNRRWVLVQHALVAGMVTPDDL